MSLAAADIAAFFDSDMPGYALATFSFGDVDGLFTDNYQALLGMIDGSAPAFTCATSDLSAVARGTAVTINGTAYTLKQGPQEDAATGKSVLLLDLAA